MWRTKEEKEARRAERREKREAKREKRQEKRAAKAEKYEREGKHKKAAKQRGKIARSDARARKKAEKRGETLPNKGGGTPLGVYDTTPTSMDALGRLLQYDDALNLNGDRNMAEEGCYFMSALGIAQTAADRTLNADQINKIRSDLQKEKYGKSNYVVEKDMFVNDPIRVIDKALGVLHSDKRASWGTKNDHNASLIGGNTQSGTHWREGDSRGNVIYDPNAGRDSNFITGNAATTDYRYFKIGY